MQPIKWHGGKHYLAKRIIDLMPPRVTTPNAPAADDPGWVHYVEPFFGGGAVLLTQNPRGISEVVNDLNGDLMNFWRVLASETHFPKFERAAQATPCSQTIFDDAGVLRVALHSYPDGDWRAALKFFIRNRQSRQALGKDFATLARNRTRRGMNELPSAWLNAIDGLPEVHSRLKRVVILNDDALKVIKQQDGPRTLFYLDPPYIQDLRYHGGGEYGEQEMTYQQHVALMSTLAGIKGRFILSGYRSPLYNLSASDNGWTRVDIEIDNKASGRKAKERKVECLWFNYERPS